MAIGLPDYSRGIRPGYGAPMSSDGSKVVAALGYTPLLEVTGKGMLYGGLVFLNHDSTQASGEVLLVVDGRYMITQSFYNLNLLGVNAPGYFPIILIKYDETNFIYAVGLGYGVTFDESLAVVYNELNTTTPTVFALLMYAVV